MKLTITKTDVKAVLVLAALAAIAVGGYMVYDVARWIEWTFWTKVGFLAMGIIFIAAGLIENSIAGAAATGEVNPFVDHSERLEPGPLCALEGLVGGPFFVIEKLLKGWSL